jgi:hypothetical protein
MKWILTLESGTQTERVRQLLEQAGSSLQAHAAMIPVDGDVAVEVEGPADLPKRIENQPEVKAVHPSSDLTLY